MRKGILTAVGKTPLIQLDKLLPGARFRLLAKIEALNPGGSAKDRPALEIIERASETGEIGLGSVIVESSSGNMGIGLAQACRYHGLRLICVVDPKASAANLKILAAYGAEVDMVTQPDPETGEYLQARLNRVRALLREIPNAFWPNQYANADNAASHYRTTMAEAAEATGGKIDFLFVATSTCGTIRGCAEYIRDHGLATRIVAVDAVGSLIFGDRPARRLIPGLGASIRPQLCAPELIDRVIHVDDVECILGCRRLVRREAIFAGGSSGGVASAIAKVREAVPAGATCLAILHDRGDRYLDTVYDDRWVRDHYAERREEIEAALAELEDEPWSSTACSMGALSAP